MIILSAHTTYARVSASNIVCTEAGSLNFKLGYSCSEDDCTNIVGMPTSRIKINATSEGKTYNIEWADPPKSIYDDRSYEFISKDDILDPDREYNITIDDREDTTHYSVTCPDFKYRCSKINLNIDLCEQVGPNVYYLFRGLGNQFSNEQLREKINYYINPAKTMQGKFTVSEELPESFEIKDIGYDAYILLGPFLDLKNRMVDDIYIEVKDCDKKIFNTSKYKSCRDIECYENNDCPIGSYCDLNKNKCKILLCSSCEKVSMHECASICKPRNICEEATCDNGACTYTQIENCCITDSDCNDNLACTKDACENNKCIHKKVECKASGDPCVIGVCEEPKGCKYVRNPECDKKTDENATSQEITGQAVKQVEKPKISFFERLILIFKMLFGIE